nr:unnamed protein product [Digitaria exilis]
MGRKRERDGVTHTCSGAGAICADIPPGHFASSQELIGGEELAKMRKIRVKQSSRTICKQRAKD